MEEFLKSITCSGTECLCWILVLFNILAVFYLVFCSFWKVTRIVKITGWVISAGLLCLTVGILIAHAELSEEQRRYFDAIGNYANGKDGVKRIESKEYML